MKLNLLSLGQSANLKSISNPLFSTKLAELGLIEGTRFSLILKAPFNGPIAIHFGNTTLSIRSEEANYLLVDKVK
jgi:Fe2+ transport system protein FeoA